VSSVCGWKWQHPLKQTALSQCHMVSCRQELACQHRALAAAKASLSAKESEASTAAATAAAGAASSLQQLRGDKARLEGRLQEVQEQLRQARQQHEVEIQVGGR
jgi:hypothetical protein